MLTDMDVLRKHHQLIREDGGNVASGEGQLSSTSTVVYCRAVGYQAWTHMFIDMPCHAFL